MATVTDNFNRANGALGANWVSPVTTASNAPGTFKIASNQAGAVTDDTHTFAAYVGAFTNDQTSQITLGSTMGAWMGAAVRVSPGLSRWYYGFVFGANDYRLYRFWDNVHEQLVAGTAVTWVPGDILKVEIIGNAHPITFNMYRNGTLVLTWTSPSSAYVKNGGSPGIGIYSPAGQNLRLDDWEGGLVSESPVTDSFTRANGGLGTNWTTPVFNEASFAIASNVVGGTLNSKFHFAFWSGQPFNDEQYSQIKFLNSGASNPASTGLILRADAAVDKFFVGMIQTLTTVALYARGFGTGTFNLLNTFTVPTLVNGDVLKLSITQTAHPFAITLYKNGLFIDSWISSDSTWVKTGGSPGIELFQNAGSVLTLDDWQGGSLTGAAYVPPVAPGLTSASLGLVGAYQKHFA